MIFFVCVFNGWGLMAQWVIRLLADDLVDGSSRVSA